MVALLEPEAADGAIALLGERGIDAWACGQVTSGDGVVTLQGAYAG
jgi:phosphoribosylaminoimidazole (AIR) synthetase